MHRSARAVALAATAAPALSCGDGGPSTPSPVQNGLFCTRADQAAISPRPAHRPSCGPAPGRLACLTSRALTASSWAGVGGSLKASSGMPRIGPRWSARYFQMPVISPPARAMSDALAPRRRPAPRATSPRTSSSRIVAVRRPAQTFST